MVNAAESPESGVKAFTLFGFMDVFVCYSHANEISVLKRSLSGFTSRPVSNALQLLGLSAVAPKELTVYSVEVSEGESGPSPFVGREDLRMSFRTRGCHSDKTLERFKHKPSGV